MRCDLIFVGHRLVDNQTSEDNRACLEGEYLCINHDVFVLRRHSGVDLLSPRIHWILGIEHDYFSTEHGLLSVPRFFVQFIPFIGQFFCLMESMGDCTVVNPYQPDPNIAGAGVRLPSVFKKICTNWK